MGFLARLFGSGGSLTKAYVDAGVEMTHSLVHSLGLRGWERDSRGCLLPVYTAEETAVIEKQFSWFQEIANGSAGGKLVFHPDVVNEIQRMQIAEALHTLAGNSRRFSIEVDLPGDWKSRVSTYLKAWASYLTPEVLLDMADLLAKEGHKVEARQALEVVLLFPSYANTYFGGSEGAERVRGVVSEAQRAIQNL